MPRLARKSKGAPKHDISGRPDEFGCKAFQAP
jgi:hypothetical protein